MSPTPARRGSSQSFTHSDGVTLKEYFEARFDAMDKALQISQASLNARLESMNEFRDAMKDQTGNFVTRNELDLIRAQMTAEYKAIISQICSDLEILKTYKATMEGKASQTSVYIALFISVMGILLGIVSLVIK